MGRSGLYDNRTFRQKTRIVSCGKHRQTYCQVASFRVGSGRVGSGRVGSGRVGSARLGSARLGSARVASRRVELS